MSDETLTFRTEELSGDMNRPVTVIANQEGLEVGESFRIPWEWIDRVRGRFPESLSQSPQLEQWILAYPSATELLRELECPDSFRQLHGTMWDQLRQNSLSHWIALGRPEVGWRAVAEWECVQLWCKHLSISLPS